MITIALFALIGVALKLTGGLAVAYWIVFGFYSLIQVVLHVAKLIKIVTRDI